MSKVFEATLGRPFTSRNAKNDPTEMLVPSGTIPRGNERIGARKGTSEANGVITKKCARIAWHGRELKLGQRSPRCASNNRGNRRMISWVGEGPKACRCSLRYIERERERKRIGAVCETPSRQRVWQPPPPIRRRRLLFSELRITSTRCSNNLCLI